MIPRLVTLVFFYVTAYYKNSLERCLHNSGPISSHERWLVASH